MTSEPEATHGPPAAGGDAHPHDWRLVPLAVAAWAGGWWGTAGLRPEPGIWFCLVAGLGLVGLFAARAGRVWMALMLVVLVVTGSMAVLREHQLHTSQPALWADAGATAQARVRIVGDPRVIDQGVRGPLVVATATLLYVEVGDEALSTHQRVVVFASGEAAASLSATAPGAEVRIRAALAPAETRAPDALVLRARTVSDQVAPPGLLDALVNSLRAGLRQAASHSPPEQAALVPSLVVGDTTGISDELSEKFRVTSLSHLLAVSGANLTLMLVVVLAFVRFVGVRGGAVRVVAVGCVGLFVLVCRHEPSVVRAAAMGLVSLSALGVGRGRRSLRHLSLAVLCLMLVDPWLSRTWGFALSVAACLGLTLLAPGWVRALSTWLPRWLAEAVAVPLAAQLSTQPLITALNGQVSVVGVVANMAAAPFVGPATVFGLVATCLVWFAPAAVAAAWLAGWCVQPILWVAHLGSALPGASIAWPADALGVLLCAIGCALLAWLLGRVLRSRVGVAALAALLVLAALVRPVPLGWPGPWQVVFCDVGQGDATVLRAADGVAVVVDAGPEPGATRRCLDSLAVRSVPILVLTHYHEDHMGGAEDLLRTYAPEVVVVSRLPSPASAARRVAEAAVQAGSRLVTAEPGQVLRVGDVSWTTLGAHLPVNVSSQGSGESAEENDASVVGIADVAGLRVLLPGDVEPTGQRRALASAADLEIPVQAHILKLPHHGSARQDAEFFKATSASVAVASAGAGNDYGHPSQQALTLAAASGMVIARTDTDGHVAISLTEAGLQVRRAGPD